MNKKELAEIALASTDSLYHISKSILKNDADCEDAVQEAIAIAFEKRHTLKKEQYAKTWLTRILINECYRILKLRNRFTSFDGCGEETEWNSRDYSELYQALFLLKKEYRLTLVLHYLEGYSVKEIAGIMDTGVGTVKSRLSRGRDRLKSMIEEERTYEII